MNISLTRGSIYMILAAFFVSLMAVMVKACGHRIPSQEIVLARSLVVFLITAWLIKRRRRSLWGQNKPLLFLRGFTGFLGLSAFYFTLTTIPIADSVMLQFTSPLFTALLAGIILKEYSSRHQWSYFLMAFAGILLIIRPGFSLRAFPAMIGLGGACCSGLAYNIVRKLRKTDHPLNIILYLPAVSIILSLPIVLPKFIIPRGWEWLLLIGAGISTQIAQIFLTLALHSEAAGKTTNVSYISVVFSTLFGMLIWSEIPDWRTLIGAMVILIAIFQIARKRRL